MHAAKIEIFFSCSFREEDKETNEFFLAICNALHLLPSNLSTGYILTPPEAAKEKISSSQALVAICTKRDELKDGSFIMPQAVHDEISFAYGKDVPLLMIKEKGVMLAGFKGNFGTYLEFDRSNMFSPEFLKKAIEALHDLKLEILGPNQVGVDTGVSDIRVDWVNHLVELRRNVSDFVWSYATSKKLVFTQASKRGIPSQVWAVVPIEFSDSEPPMSYSLVVTNSSRGITIDDKIEEHTPSCIRSIMRFSPTADEGDFVEYLSTYESRYLNPLWRDEVPAGSLVHLESGDFMCADGFVFIHRTKKALIEFRFPREYGLKKSEVKPLVVSYTSSVDYDVPSEIDRANFKIEEFAGNLVIRIEVSSPLPGHMYGVAWNPRPRPVV